MKMAVLWAVVSAGLAMLAGCGLASNPQPPTLWLPAPVKNLTAARVGNEVHLAWTMPRETTDKVPLKGDQKTHFCWENEAGVAAAEPRFREGSCAAAGDAEFPPRKPANFVVPLAPALATGAPRAVSYFIELQNHAGKTAGPSNGAWVAAGNAPPALSGLRLATQAEGVILRWTPAAPEPGMVLRIHRWLLNPPSATGKNGASHPNQANGVAAPAEQTLEVPLDRNDRGGAVDRDASLDHVWKYQAERVLKVNVEGHALEIAGVPSAMTVIDAKDVFPPATPSGLAAVADVQAHAIDLSWEPDRDADLAGYVVYRSDLTAGGGAERISGKALLVPPSLSDSTAQAGHRYAYSVSAVDEDGNESARSKEVDEELPQ